MSIKNPTRLPDLRPGLRPGVPSTGTTRSALQGSGGVVTSGTGQSSPAEGAPVIGDSGSTPDLPPGPTSVASSVPGLQGGKATGKAGLWDVRLGQAQVKRVWTKLQALVGVGDPGALKRAGEIVGQTRVLEKALSSLSPEAFAAKAKADMADIRAAITGATQGLRDEVKAKAAAVRALEKTNAPTAEAARGELKLLEASLRRAELEVLDMHIPRAFALSSEASARALKMRPHDEQLQAGALLVRSKVVEQYTGEGKTLSAVAPAVLAAMGGRGVHIATSSEYLARRDAELMAPAFNALGLSVSALLPDGGAILISGGKVTDVSRKDAYLADVTYGTAAQFGFDHLRDNLAKREGERVQRGHPTLIMDEVDSLLIDDARTPLIISGKAEDPQAELRQGVGHAVEELVLGEHIEFDRSQGTATLTDEGFDKLAGLLGLDDPMLMQDEPLGSLVNAAVRARVLFVNGIDYIVKNDAIELIGKNGEVLPGRRLSAGLHQAIEAREGVTIQPETRTIGSITLRDYLGLYDRVGGMTGTAEVSEALFDDVYKLDVVRVPTHKPLQRVDDPPRLFRTIEEKAMAVMADALAESARGRPVLIGCPDERTVAALSALFAENNIPHRTLTAQNEAEEAHVIADAGRAGAITLSTPRGGRGVDFKLGGAGATDAERKAVVDAGGLMVLGFAHNSSARIDNQLRGRAARQGDPGSTRFYASLEDRFFQNRELPKWVTERPPGAGGLQSRQVTALIEEHSRLGESLMQSQLKESLPFDGVIGLHRRRWLEQRESVMRGDVVDAVHGIVESSLGHIIDETLQKHGSGDAGLWELYKALAMVVPLPKRDGAPPSWKGKDARALEAHILPQLGDALATFLERLGPAKSETLKDLFLTALDDGFCDHLDELDRVRAGVGWVKLAQKDPKLAFVEQSSAAWQTYIRGALDVVTRAVMGSMPPVELT